MILPALEIFAKYSGKALMVRDPVEAFGQVLFVDSTIAGAPLVLAAKKPPITDASRGRFWRRRRLLRQGQSNSSRVFLTGASAGIRG
ncbi:hypothetical protein ABZ917_41795 [Nonomuraea wenchangensis]